MVMISRGCIFFHGHDYLFTCLMGKWSGPGAVFFSMIMIICLISSSGNQFLRI